ncbi:rhomboid family intramembrane serine protease GlpG [Oceanisphaera avium]|uniref:Rhomboid family intramembrane serine protease GlpG n=1 Tax=Oceanisphaera avium TaxID=1903694 RepID=A0A1Y0CYB8_9GAMM|nr:rhomboid family intramembrane serine protease GlpG [Oceanisphaera avium]ART80320.1 rhomboid family intramembrane serine protease GlpG [Oceanisphaera avium]
MKLLLVVEDARRAQAFVDYLTAQGLACEQTLDDAHRVSIWLIDEHRFADAEPEVARFLKEPFHPRYQEAAWLHGDTHIKFASQAASKQNLAQLAKRTGPVNLIVLLSCVLIYGLAQLGAPVLAWLSFPAQLSQLVGVNFWRAFTPALLHFSLMHLVFNLFWWWYLASMVEREWGAGRLILILLVAGILPNFMQFFASGPYFGGLSGVVYALLAYVWLSGRLNPGGRMSLPDGMAVLMLVWLILGFAGVLGNVANLAHLGGGLIGLLQAVVDRQLRHRY